MEGLAGPEHIYFRASGAQEDFVGSFLVSPLEDHLPATDRDTGVY